MPIIRPAKPSFTSGRISPRLLGRIDLNQYVSGLQECNNFLVLPHGGIMRRPGTGFVSEVKDSADEVRLIPFLFSNADALCLEFGPSYIRFYKNRGRVEVSSTPVEVTTSYTAGDLPTLQFAQSGDILFLAGGGQKPQELRRASDTSWSIVDYVNRDGPYYLENVTSTTLTPSSTSGSITVTASSTTGINGGDGFQTTDVGRLIRIQDLAGDWTWLEITARSSTTQVTATVKGDALADTDARTTWRLGAWSDTDGWPTALVFHQQRLFFARDRYIWGSATDDIDNFAPSLKDGTVEDSNAVTYELVPGRFGIVRWMQSSRVLEVGTGGAEFTLSGAQGVNSPLTPSPPRASKEQELGSAENVIPVFTRNGTVFVNRTGTKMINFYYSFQQDGYIPTDITILSEDITQPTITETSFQSEPDQVIWSVRSDGRLLGCTFDPSQDVTAWHTHTFGGTFSEGAAEVESITTLPTPDGTADETWLVVKRTIDGNQKRYIEYISPPFLEVDDVTDAKFVDSFLTYTGSATNTLSGLDHLEGELVTALADGYLYRDLEVTSGEITLPNGDTTTKAVVGLPYTSRAKLLPVEPGLLNQTLTAQLHRVREVGVNYYRTLYAKIGMEGKALETLTLPRSDFVVGEPQEPQTGVQFLPVETGSDFRNEIVIEQDTPYPCTILSILPVIET